jgi:hypothetical protein
MYQRQDHAHASLGNELNILSKASDQRVAEKAQILQKQLKVSSMQKRVRRARLHVITPLDAFEEGWMLSNPMGRRSAMASII